MLIGLLYIARSRLAMSVRGAMLDSVLNKHPSSSLGYHRNSVRLTGNA